uniref:Uncharacterized protein n=1 Tax=Ditylenchus dipsaci TaxID=166011 RepID=A0A915E4U8_9BILA
MVETDFQVVNKVVIVGTGLMGTGITQVALEAGVQVTMVGRTDEKCDSARTKITNGVNKTAKRKLASESQEIQQSWIETNLEEADMVVEAIVENLKVKQKLFIDLEKVVPSHCLLVTNTSSFLLEDVSCKMEQKKQNFGGLHFFNPVPAMKLVEVVRGMDTSDVAYDALFRFCQRLGKTPVKCKDSPGFIVNRLLVPYLADAMRLAENGDADLMDYIGLDTMKFILDGWHQRMPDDHRYTPCNSLDKLVSSGKMGLGVALAVFCMDFGNNKSTYGVIALVAGAITVQAGILIFLYKRYTRLAEQYSQMLVQHADLRMDVTLVKKRMKSLEEGLSKGLSPKSLLPPAITNP